MTYTDEMSVEKCLVMPHALNGKPVEVKRAVGKEHGPGGGMGSGLGAGGPRGGMMGGGMMGMGGECAASARSRAALCCAKPCGATLGGCQLGRMLPEGLLPAVCLRVLLWRWAFQPQLLFGAS